LVYQLGDLTNPRRWPGHPLGFRYSRSTRALLVGLASCEANPFQTIRRVSGLPSYQIRKNIDGGQRLRPKLPGYFVSWLLRLGWIGVGYR